MKKRLLAGSKEASFLEKPFVPFGRSKRLRVEYIGGFDGTANTPTAVAYCKRLTSLADSYGAYILATLPLCIQGNKLA